MVRRALAAPIVVLLAVGCASLRPPPPPSDPPAPPVAEEIGAAQDIEVAPVIARALAALGGDRATTTRVRTEEIERHAFTAWQSRIPGSPPIEMARTRLVRSVNPARGEEVLIEEVIDFPIKRFPLGSAG